MIMLLTFEPLLNFFRELDWKEVLRFYLLAVIVFIPFEVWLFVWLRKKTQLIATIEEYLDAVVANSEEAKKLLDEKNRRESADQRQIIEEADMTTWERRERNFISCLRLRVNDQYHCGLSEIQKLNLNGNRFWTVSNKSICDIDEQNGVLTVKKVGCCDVFCGDKDEDGIKEILYYIESSGAIEKWIGKQVYDDVLLGRSIDDVKAAMKGRKLLSLDLDKSIIRYAGVDGCKTVAWQHSRFIGKEGGNVLRAVMEIKNKKVHSDEIIAALDERMEPLASENKDIRYWCHFTEDGTNVDAIAFVHYKTADTFLFGISRIWKSDCEKKEVQRNIDMIIREFSDITTGETGNATKIREVKEAEEEQKKVNTKENETSQPSADNSNKEAEEKPQKSGENNDEKEEPSTNNENTETGGETEEETTGETNEETGEDGNGEDINESITDGGDDISDGNDDEENGSDGSEVEITDPMDYQENDGSFDTNN